MNLYLMRHANAGLSRGNPILDAKRGLIKEGKEQCMLMARVLNALKVQVDVIVSSPLKRALQTAQFVGTEMGYDAKVEISPALGPRRTTPLFSNCWRNMPTAKACCWWATIPTSSSSSAASSPATAAPACACARAPWPASTWTAIRPCCSGSSIRAWPAAIYASVAKSSRPKTSRK